MIESLEKLANPVKGTPYPSVVARERRADGFIHIIGLGSALIACAILMTSTAMQAGIAMIIACAIYCLGVVMSFVSSAGYHLLPWHSWRDTLRRFDHAAIYALIAGTFTPLLVHTGTTLAYSILAAVWLLAIPAILYKLFADDIEPSWSLASYLGLGWIAIFAIPDFGERLSMVAILTIVLGGLIYTAGTYFYAKKVQAYRYAIWHGFVLAGTSLFFVAVWMTVFYGDGTTQLIAANPVPNLL
ncbi:MAG: hemolysin III family protein [Pseudomonadota bacterium]